MKISKYTALTVGIGYRIALSYCDNDFDSWETNQNQQHKKMIKLTLAYKNHSIFCFIEYSSKINFFS